MRELTNLRNEKQPEYFGPESVLYEYVPKSTARKWMRTWSRPQPYRYWKYSPVHAYSKTFIGWVCAERVEVRFKTGTNKFKIIMGFFSGMCQLRDNWKP